jgi:hypothetical protein
MMVGRNDPCPCGSGKKYKRCCFKADDVQKRVGERQKDPDEVLPADSSIYKVWLEWRSARKRSDFNFLYDLIEPATPLAEKVGGRDAFIAACADGAATVPSGESANFRHLRIEEGERAQLLQTVGDDDSAMAKVRCERLGFKHTERGWRLSDFEVVEVKKDDGQEIGLGLFE